MDEVKKDGEIVVPAVETVVEIDPLAEKDRQIAKLTEERDNYKIVALKRKGKLPGDETFFREDTSELSVAEQVKLELMDKEINDERKARDVETRRILKENSELKLALKNRPQDSIGGSGSGATIEVKDNVLSDAQRTDLIAKANRLKVDPEKFIENFKKNLLAHK